MRRIRIPATIEGVSGLLTARRWEKAAIVWAYCKPRRGSRTTRENRASDQYTFKEFAALGVAGLTDPDTVVKYWRAWQSAIDAGMSDPVGPGQAGVPEPNLPWPSSGAVVVSEHLRQTRPHSLHLYLGTETLDLYHEIADRHGLSVLGVALDAVEKRFKELEQ